MANLIIEENGVARTTPAVNGEEITILAPCDCSEVTGVQINSVVFPFYDAAGNSLETLTGLFTEGSLIRVMVDTTNTRAYILNAGNNIHSTDTTKHITTDERNAWNAKAQGTHASQHYKGGRDAITPEDIGAVNAETSRTKNQVLASPNGEDGSPTFRELVADDIPDLPTSKIIGIGGIETVSYVGTGTLDNVGESFTVSVTFTHTPKLVYLYNSSNYYFTIIPWGCELASVQVGGDGNGASLTLTYNGNTMSWSYEADSLNHSAYMNYCENTYTAIAIY